MTRHDSIAVRATRALTLAALGTLLLSGLGGCAVRGRVFWPARSECECGPAILEAIAWFAVNIGAHAAQGCH